MTELALMLPDWQVDGLDELARQRGMNIGQLLRRLIGDLLRDQAQRS